VPNRRFALYFSWSRPSEIDVDLGVLENRFPTLFEFRRAIWPLYEWAANPANYRQDVSGFMDHVILFDFQHFSNAISELTGQPVEVIQRLDDQPPVQELDEEFLSTVDTLIVVSLDHIRTRQAPTEGEIQALRHFLEREDSCLILCPHHRIGMEDDQAYREAELKHHGDRLVPPQQEIGGFARAILEALAVPAENRYGLSPARSKTVGGPEPLQTFRDLDEVGILKGVTTFNAHAHLPHLHVPANATGVHVLAKQLINPDAAPHPFTDAGNRYFNVLLWLPPSGSRHGNVYVCDATIWSSAFEGVKGLEQFWKNLAELPR
jgi:hypothetical protein